MLDNEVQILQAGPYTQETVKEEEEEEGKDDMADSIRGIQVQADRSGRSLVPDLLNSSFSVRSLAIT